MSAMLGMVYMTPKIPSTILDKRGLRCKYHPNGKAIRIEIPIETVTIQRCWPISLSITSGYRRK